jgi:hypothetical protein
MLTSHSTTPSTLHRKITKQAILIWIPDCVIWYSDITDPSGSIDGSSSELPPDPVWPKKTGNMSSKIHAQKISISTIPLARWVQYKISAVTV